jgi:OFA family oxalate/formate antiporter-like MFS transporter
VSGRAIARRGEVACGSLGALLSGLGLIASSQCTTLWQLYVTYGVMLGVGQSLGLYSGVIACNKWFPENTALASGFANSGAGVGPFAIPFLWAALKRETNGWRGALAALGAMVFAVLLAGALGLAPPPPSSEKRAPVSPIAVSAVPGVRRLMRTTFIFGFGFWIPAVHIVRYGLDRDLSRRRAESLLLYLGAGALTMRVPVGALADRCGRSRVYSAVCLTYAVALARTCVETLRHRADAVTGTQRRVDGAPEIRFPHRRSRRSGSAPTRGSPSFRSSAAPASAPYCRSRRRSSSTWPRSGGTRTRSPGPRASSARFWV